MPNMSYCRFENTYNALQDCYYVLNDDVKKLSKTEQLFRKMLIQLCQDVLDETIKEPEQDE